MSELPAADDKPEVIDVIPVDSYRSSLRMKIVYGAIAAACLIGWLADPVTHRDAPPPVVSTTLPPR